MKKVFAGSLFWTAIVRPDDPYRESALEAAAGLEGAVIVTTEEVLSEFLAAVARYDRHIRQAAVKAVEALRVSDQVQVIAQSHNSFVAGLERYKRRLDKRYSLTDCISMNAMEEYGIREVLSNDHHFEQEGFHLLID